MIMTPRQFAKLVKELRTVQKSSGSGYKTSTASTQATALEKQVDAEIANILKFWPFDESPKAE